MKRPLCIIGFTMLISQFVFCETDSVLLPLFIGGLCSLAAAVTLLIKRKVTGRVLVGVTVLFSVTLSAALFLTYQAFCVTPSYSLIGERKIEAVVTDYPTVDDSRIHVFAKIENTDSPYNPNVRLSFSKSTKFDGAQQWETVTNLKPGDKVTFNGKVYKIAASYKSANQSYKSKKVFIGSYPTSRVTVEKESRKSLSFILKLHRQRLINQLRSTFNEDSAGLAISVLLGDKGYLKDELFDMFRACGVSHIMAVSGLHLSIWMMFVMSVALYFGLDKRKVSVALLVFVFLVMNFAMFSASIMRAGVMMTVYLLGFVVRRQPDTLNSLGCACAILILQNPFCVLNVGFLLSVTSCLAIICGASPIMKSLEKAFERIESPILNKLVYSVTSAFIISVCVFVFTMPVCTYFFGSVTPMSLIGNIVFLPVVSPMIVLFGLSVMFYFVPVLSNVLNFLAGLTSLYSIAAARILSSFEAGVVYFEKKIIPLALVLGVVCACLICIFIVSKRKGVRVFSFLGALLSVAVCLSCNAEYKEKTASITVYSVSDGLCVSVSQGRFSSLLFARCSDYSARFISETEADTNAIILPNIENANSRLISSLKKARLYSDDDSYLYKNAEKLKGIRYKDIFVETENETVFVTVRGVRIAVGDENKEFNADAVITSDINCAEKNKDKTVIFSSCYDIDGAFSTASYSDITMTIKGENSYEIRGENSWRNLMKKP